MVHKFKFLLSTMLVFSVGVLSMNPESSNGQSVMEILDKAKKINPNLEHLPIEDYLGQIELAENAFKPGLITPEEKTKVLNWFTFMFTLKDIDYLEKQDWASDELKQILATEKPRLEYQKLVNKSKTKKAEKYKLITDFRDI